MNDRDRRLPRFASILCLLFIAAPAAWAQARGASDAARNGVRAIETAAGGPVQASYSPLTGRVTFLAVPKGRGVAPSEGGLATAPARAVSFLRAHGAAFGLGPEATARVMAEHPRDEAGLEHVRLRQEYRGVPVVAAELMVHLRGELVVAVNGHALPDLAVDTVPTVSAEQAQKAVRDLARKHMGKGEVETSKPELQILSRGLLDGSPSPTALTWFVVASGEALREFVWVDAHRGAVLLHFSQLPEARNRTVYTANNSSTLPGTQIGSETSPPPGSDTDATLAFLYAGDTYDYFLSKHGRDSYDAAGGELRSSVHYCSTSGCPLQNAFWNGTQMVYGEGFASADDVVGHELTHAVTERTAGLFYYMQSGALNESFSDIFGEAVDLLNGHGTDTSDKRWSVGEDLANGAIRNMMNPQAFGDPGRTGDTGFACGGANGNSDNGGVHTNSGVPNHAYALMVDGGSYNGYAVTGIGQTKADKIQYRTLTRYLMTGSDFLDDYNAIKQACSDLVGTAVTSADCTEVGKALDAVQLNAAWPCTPAQAVTPPALCASNQTAVDVWSDDFESTTSGKWTSSLLAGTYNHWNVTVPGLRTGTGDSSLYFDKFAGGGRYHLWAFDHAYAGEASAQMASAVTLPASARLQFNHSFGFENSATGAYDGGVLEYCTGSCTSWNDAGALISAGAQYSDTISYLYDNPLGGRSAFTGESWGYTATQLDLGTLAGQAFKLRFRIGTDTDGDDWGWFVDDVRIYRCAAAATPSITSFTPTSGPVGSSVTITGTNLSGASAVAFNGTAAAFAVNSATQITATVPNGASTGPISVTTPGGTATSGSSFTVTAAGPSITSFTPPSGPVGSSVAILGTGLSGASAVRFNGTSTGFTVNSATRITATVPNGASTGPISVTTPGGTATSGSSFTVTVGASADLSILGSGPHYAVRGGNLLYTTVVTNNGPGTATSVSVAAEAPSALEFVSNTGACTTPFPCALGTLASGAQATIQTTVRVPVGYTPVPISVSTTVSSAASDPNSGNNTSTVTTRFGSFFTLTPCRLVDTRDPGSLNGPPALQPAQPRTFVFAGGCGVPAGATAVALNVTVTGGTAYGDLRLYPSDVTSVPLVSTINFGAGATRANNAILVGSANGDVSMTVLNDSTAAVHLIIDVTGYFE